MPNYRETTASGTSYTRAHTVIINNDLHFKNIEFQEERVFVLDDGETLNQRQGHLDCEFTAETAATTFPVINPETGTDTGATASYGEVYALLFSVYMHMAAERDSEVMEEPVAPAVAESPAETAARLEQELVYAREAVARMEAEAEAARLAAGEV